VSAEKFNRQEESIPPHLQDLQGESWELCYFQGEANTNEMVWVYYPQNKEL